MISNGNGQTLNKIGKTDVQFVTKNGVSKLKKKMKTQCQNWKK